MKNLTILLSIFALSTLFSCEKSELVLPEQSQETATEQQSQSNEKRGDELDATFTTSSFNNDGTIPVFNPPNGTTTTPSSTTTTTDNPIGPIPIFTPVTADPGTQETTTVQLPSSTMTLPIKFPSNSETP